MNSERMRKLKGKKRETELLMCDEDYFIETQGKIIKGKTDEKKN